MNMEEITPEFIRRLKAEQMDQLSAYRQDLYKKPELRQLFFELTMRCNLECFHCGSSCSSRLDDGLPLQKYKEILDEVKENFDISKLLLCITGGEPLLRPDFFEIMEYAHSLGYRWGMTSNGTLITPEVARRLREAGMRTISISIDGLEKTHDAQRKRPGSWKAAMRGIQNLIDEGGFHAIQVTTVMNHQSMDELDDLYELFCEMDIDSWRVIGLEPIGRALEAPELMLTRKDQRRLFTFIKEKREEEMPVTYGCSHFLGVDFEREVRQWYFLCNAGLYVASIMANGDVGACLDIERSKKTVQGNIYENSFTEIWQKRFADFRRPLSLRNEECRNCEYEKWCAGGSRHSWDYENEKQRICMKGTLF